MRSFLRLGLSLFLFTTFIDPPTAAVVAQTVDVTGSVKDSSGAVLSGATVAGLSVATAITGPEGRYTVALAPSTLHQLRVRMKGFADEAFDIRTASGDASYESVLGYPALPRSVVAGVRFDIAAGR